MQERLDLFPKKDLSPCEYADALGEQYAASVSKAVKKENGQFFTPQPIARFMAGLTAKPTFTTIKVLDPGCGTGILSCALIEQLAKNKPTTIELVAYELDVNLLAYTERSLENLKDWLAAKGISFYYTLLCKDFIADQANSIGVAKAEFDYIISNPPYFKLSKDDPRVLALAHLVKGQPNIYSFFMAVSVNLLKEKGEMIFITPRSFASGQYFNAFRDYFFSKISLKLVHLFKTRSKTFKRDKVLQETLIIQATKKKTKKVVLSTSEGLKDIQQSLTKTFAINELIDLKSPAKILHLPTTCYEEAVIALFRSWRNQLIDYNIQISTGPVVSFRARPHFFRVYQNTTVFLAPLFWLDNVVKMKVNWPIVKANKEQYINKVKETQKLLLPNKNYVFLRRFSSKDDESRLIAAPYFSQSNKTESIGVENKLNYIYKLKGELRKNESIGLSAILNSKIFDTYFRTFNGNTNVSATEIRLMPMPPLKEIESIGDQLIEAKDFSVEKINSLVNKWLEKNTFNDENKRSPANIEGLRAAKTATK